MPYRFHCQKNLNNIDLLTTLGYDFLIAVTILEQLLNRHQSRFPQAAPTPETE